MNPPAYVRRDQAHRHSLERLTIAALTAFVLIGGALILALSYALSYALSP